MKLRSLEKAEYEAIKLRMAPDGTPYQEILPDAQMLEAAFVVESNTGKAIATALAIRVPEIVLIVEKDFHPSVKIAAIAEIHREMRERMNDKGYPMGFAVVSPAFRGYIRHMIRKFGWVKDFPAYRIR